MNLQTENFSRWYIHPLSYLSTSGKEISPREQREYLCGQEANIQKLCRESENSTEFLSTLLDIKKAELSNILAANSQYLDDNNQNELQDMIYEARDSNKKLDALREELWVISHSIGITYEMTRQGFNSVINSLDATFDLIGQWFIKSNMYSQSLLSSIQSLTNITNRVLGALEDIDYKLGNPKKIIGLELKRDALQFYRNGWFEESIKASQESCEYIYTDYENYYLQGVVYFEELKDYTKAKDALEKAVRYSLVNNKKLHDFCLLRLAMIHFINWDSKRALDCQLHAIDTFFDPMAWLQLARYSAHVGDRVVFEDAVYKAISGDKLNIIKLTTEPCFTDEDWKVEMVSFVSRRIKEWNTKWFVSEIIRKSIDNRMTKDDEWEIHPWYNRFLRDANGNYNCEQLREVFFNETDVNKIIKFIKVAFVSFPGNNIKELLKLFISFGIRECKEASMIFTEYLWNIQWSTDMEMLYLFMRAWVDFNKRDSNGETLFFKFLGYTQINIEIVKFLLGTWSDAKVKNTSNHTCLDRYLSNNTEPSLEVVELLIKAGVDTKQPDKNGQTALYKYLKNKTATPEIITLFIESGIDIHFKDRENNTYLNIYLDRGDTEPSLEVVELLIKAGVDTKQPDKNGQTALYKYLKNKTATPEIVKLLAMPKASINFKDKNDNSYLDIYLSRDDIDVNIKVVELLIKAGVNIKLPDKNGQTALYKYLKNKTATPEIVKLLVKSGIDVNGPANSEKEPHLFAYLAKTFFVPKPKIVQELLYRGASIDYKCTNYGKGHLHRYLQKYCYDGYDNAFKSELDHTINPEVVRILINAGVNVNSLDKSETTGLAPYLEHESNIEIVKLLVDAWINLGYHNWWGNSYANTLLESVNADSRVIEILELFKKKWLDMRQVHPFYGRTLLHSYLGLKKTPHSIEVVRFLIRSWVSASTLDCNNFNCLHQYFSSMFAYEYPQMNIVRLLRDAGADISMRNNDNESPMDMFMRNWLKARQSGGSSNYDRQGTWNFLCDYMGGQSYARDLVKRWGITSFDWI